jgi:tetratricopeptide (TPR) repeat protein
MREAVKEYEAAVGMTSDPGLLAQTYANLGAAYRGLGDDERAQASYKHALQYNPKQFNAWLGLGRLAQQQGKSVEAITNLSRFRRDTAHSTGLLGAWPRFAAVWKDSRGAHCL